MQKLSPRLLDAVALLVGFKSQETDEPKPANAPNNLFAPMPGYERSGGDFTARSLPTSLYNWLEIHLAVRHGVIADSALALGAVIAARATLRSA